MDTPSLRVVFFLRKVALSLFWSAVAILVAGSVMAFLGQNIQHLKDWGII